MEHQLEAGDHFMIIDLPVDNDWSPERYPAARNEFGFLSPQCKYFLSGQALTARRTTDGVAVTIKQQYPYAFIPIGLWNEIVDVVAEGIGERKSYSEDQISGLRTEISQSGQPNIEKILANLQVMEEGVFKDIETIVLKSGYQFSFTYKFTADDEFRLLYTIGQMPTDYKLSYSQSFKPCELAYQDNDKPFFCEGFGFAPLKPWLGIELPEEPEQPAELRAHGITGMYPVERITVPPEEEEEAFDVAMGREAEEEARAPESLEAERKSIWEGGACSLMPNASATAGTLFAVFTMFAVFGVLLVLVRRRNK